MDPRLDEIRHLHAAIAAAATAATARRNRRIAEAIAEGVPQRDIARALGVTREAVRLMTRAARNLG